MIKFGKAPYLECSTRGDRRFSAFCARPKSLGGWSIEEAYQAMKVFGDGTTGLSWREAKGRYPINMDECKAAYDRWWTEWVDEQGLLPVLRRASGLSDMFGKPGSVCQAEVLWRLRGSVDPVQLPLL
jgi:hypothetical protein